MDSRTSDPFVPSATLELEQFAQPRRSARTPILWGLACLGAIILGVIPALLINHFRNAQPPPTASRVVAPSTPVAPPTPAAATAPPATASSDTPAVAPTVPTIDIDVDETKSDQSHTTDHVRRPPTHPAKRPTAAPCDVYLHPHGCPH